MMPDKLCESSRASLRLVCPLCRGKFMTSPGSLACSACARRFPVIDGIPVLLVNENIEASKFYEDFHRDPHKAFDLKGIGTPIYMHPFVRKNKTFFRNILNIPFKRDRFFKRVKRMLSAREGRQVVLDLGCGGGNNELHGQGEIIGLDYSLWALKNGPVTGGYAMLINGDATMLPFEDATFDCIVTSDVIGHVPNDLKEKMFSEMSRVMKPGGICGHVIETDADTFIHRFEKSRPDLYKKYFIDGAGGHVGLERPTKVLERFREAGIEPVSVTKYFTYVRDIESFIALFDNEYRDESPVVRGLLAVYKLLSRNFSIKITATVLSGMISYLVDAVTQLDAAEGLIVIGEKRQ